MIRNESGLPKFGVSAEFSDKNHSFGPRLTLIINHLESHGIESHDTMGVVYDNGDTQLDLLPTQPR